MIRMLLKPLSFLPAILMMYVIFGFSAQDGMTSSELSYKVSHKIVEIGSEVIGMELMPQEIDSLAVRFHGPVRKIAHMTEYFALAVSVAFPLYVYGLRGILLMLVAGLFCVAFACGDEYHQSYIDGRGPSKRDVLIDSFGVFWGIVLVRIVGWTGRKTIFRPFNRKKKKQKQLNPDAAAMGYPPYGPDAPSVYPPGSAPWQPYPSDAPAYRNAAPYPYSGPNPGVYPGPGGRPGAYPGNGPYPGSGPYPDQSGCSPYGAPYEEEDEDSDRLSEDMSFRKLMQDLKEQKKEHRQQRKNEKKPRLEGGQIPPDEP